MNADKKEANSGRPHAIRLDPGNYAHSVAITTRYSDLDTQNHLNNVAIAGLFETGRVRFAHYIYETHGSRAMQSRGVLVSLHINYLGEGDLSGDVVVYSAIGDVGNTSCGIMQLMMQGNKRIATSDTTWVRLGDNGPEPIPEEVKDATKKYQFKG